MSTRQGPRRCPAALTRAVIDTLETRRLLATFGVIGDTSAGTSFNSVVSLVKSWNPDHIITEGDNYYSADPTLDGLIGQAFHDYISPYTGAFGAGSPSGNRFWPAIGDKDWDHS